ncbi:phage integrase family [Clostridium cylindrosporum DSM 605]|uniref:Phage integrase family n=2 Tax=Clostridium cylindrosporum TaxID=1495 RepID=A0A0J8G1D7_CLOCY|nr:phage integrase family [Clostridium cylindrosporum DSM 605]
MLSMALKHAVGWQMLNYNPASAVKPPRPEHIEMNIWDSDTINEVLKELKESNSNLYIPILIGVTTGMRQGEIAALRWRNIDFTNGFISVTHNFQKIDNSNNYALTSPKTNKSNRSIAMMDLTIKELKAHKKKQNELIMLNRDFYNNQDFVCAFEDGSPFKPVYIGELFRKFIRRSNYPKIRFHDLRHSHATLLLKQGVNPKIVSERLGHANISITLDTYSHVLPNMQKEAISKLNEMF